MSAIMPERVDRMRLPCLCGPFERHVIATIALHPPGYWFGEDGTIVRSATAEEENAFARLADARKQCERHRLEEKA